MTLVVDQGSDGPRVHALVVGVGAYRHLPGGTEPVTHDTLGLRQLSGPPVSARAFADWVATSLRHPRVPLGTVELLTSPGPPDGIPSMATFATVFEKWYARCDTHEDNVALFYFCGHGVERESLFLLLEDVGRSPLSLLENALDVGQTYQGMARCRAREQYFFVDACREIPFQLLQQLSGNARVLVTPQLVGDQRRDTALVYATSGGAKAYGKAGQVTRFTQALIRALDGLGGRLDGASWVVDLSSLQRAVTQLLARGGDGAPVQVPSVRGAGLGVLHRFERAPVVPVSLACLPPAAITAATITLSPLAALPGAVPGAPAPPLVAGPGGWSVDVPADIYTLAVDFPDGGYTATRKSIAALPPGVYDEPVEVLS